jgi:hypothetical protein
MSEQTMKSTLFVELSEEQQELVAGGQGTTGMNQGIGGTDFELSSSNFAQISAVLVGQTNSGPEGSDANSAAEFTNISTAAQDFLGLGAGILPSAKALGNAPSLI